MRKRTNIIIALLSLLICSFGAFGQSGTASRIKPSTFAALGTPPNGSKRYCSNCQATLPCTSGGSGAEASRINGAWNCSSGAGGVGDVTLAGPQTLTGKKTFTPSATIAMLNIGTVAAAPSTPAAGDKYLNSGDNKEYTYSNAAWREVFLAGVSLVNLTSNVTGVLPLANGGTANEQTIQLVAVDFATDTATGDGKDYFVVPARLNGYDLVGVRADIFTVGTTGTLNVDLDKCAVVATGSKCSGTVADMLSTNLTVDSNEDDSDTAAAAAVINASNDGVVTGDTIRVNIDGIHTTAAKGLTVTLLFRLP